MNLKKISRGGVPHALEKAERYRLLDEPVQAESICRDVLAIDANNQKALRSLILALTDQFGTDAASAAKEAREYIQQLDDDYDRAYFTGIVYERETRAYLDGTNIVRSAAYDGFLHAMEWYEKAEAMRQDGNVDAVLRWNSCVRTIERERLEPAVEERELPLE